MKFENLEEKMSKWTGLNKQTKNLSKFEGKKKLSFGFREEKQGKTVKIREKLEKIREKKPVNVLGLQKICLFCLKLENIVKRKIKYS